MPISNQLKEYLDKEHVSYENIEHTVDYTAQEIAGDLHIPGKQMIKAVILKTDKEYIMCVMPAIHMIDFAKLKNLTGAKDIRLAEEDEIGKIFPQFEIGAEPPFGHLFGLKVFMDKALEDDDEIVFNGGTHTDVVRMRFRDYLRLANPVIADFGTHI